MKVTEQEETIPQDDLLVENMTHLINYAQSFGPLLPNTQTQ